MNLTNILEKAKQDIVSSKIIPKDLVDNIISLIDAIRIPGIHNIQDAHSAMSNHIDLVATLSWLRSRWKYKRDEQFFDIYRASSDHIRGQGGRLTENEIVSNIWSDHGFSKAEILSQVFDSLNSALVIRGKFLEQISNNIRLVERSG